MSPQSPYLEDARLITAFKEGDLAAFEELYRYRFEDLCTYVSTLVSDEDAADVVQEVFWTIWNKRSGLVVKNDIEFFYYLLRAVRNRALMILRHERVRDSHLASLEQSVATTFITSELDDNDLLVDVRMIVDALPLRSREVLVLRWYHGLGFEEIASIMEVSYGYVRLLHTRALAMLRTRLKEQVNKRG